MHSRPYRIYLDHVGPANKISGMIAPINLSRLCAGLLLALSAPCASLLQAAPVLYAGKVAINGVNVDGTARFTFALRDANGTILWRNGPDANSSINVPVHRGEYICLLGGQGMNPIPGNLFLDHPQLYLQVRFDQVDTQEWKHLLPDQRITSAPHALTADLAELARRATVADAVKPGGVTKDMLALD
ncbi:uncharacterized protein METZ01_LOCUS471921, partial [marine metagenome]